MSTETPSLQESIAADDQPTCPNGSKFCPVDNPALGNDRLECFDCRLQHGRADERPADAMRDVR